MLDHTCGYCSLLPNLLKGFGWNPGKRMLKWFGEQLKERTGDGDITFKEVCGMVVKYSQIPLYGPLIITDSLLCCWRKRVPINTLSLNSTPLNVE